MSTKTEVVDNLLKTLLEISLLILLSYLLITGHTPFTSQTFGINMNHLLKEIKQTLFYN